ncbi:MAG TPA: hypothetical protein VG010_09580 [Solirubrobacteraceae bacterium]|jgi:uncharacterized cupredoxin-like copper-binding protein|nr:hypothetical protein [Solirubrobacteraceae bacterium]
MRTGALALALPAGALLAIVCTPAAPAHRGRSPVAARARHHARSLPSALGVREHEYRIGLSRLSVSAGTVIVELDNEGQDAHDLRVAPVGSEQPVLSFAELRSGGRATQTVTLRRGTYRLWCSLPGHEAAGMRALLRVN